MEDQATKMEKLSTCLVIQISMFQEIKINLVGLKNQAMDTSTSITRLKELQKLAPKGYRIYKFNKFSIT